MRYTPATISAFAIAALIGPICPLTMITYLPGQIGVESKISILPALSISSAVWMPTGILLTSTQVDEEAQHFYRKLGYKDCGGFVIDVPGYEQPMELFMIKGI